MRSTRHHGTTRSTTVGLATVGVVLLLATGGGVLFASDPAVGSTWSARDEAATDVSRTMVRLTATGPTVEEMVDAVRRQARRTPGADGDVEVTVVLSGDLERELGDGRPLLAGQQRDGTAFVRVDVAWPERTVIHEAAHVVTDGDGHGEIWRAVYLGAITDLYGPDAAHREAHRIAWTYDRCYLTDACPERVRHHPSS